MGAALLGFIPLASPGPLGAWVSRSLRRLRRFGCARPGRPLRARARRYAGRYERDYGDRDYAPSRAIAPRSAPDGKQQTASLEPPRSSRYKVAETKPRSKLLQAKVERPERPSDGGQAESRPTQPEGPRRHRTLPVERKVAATDVKTLHGTGKTQSGMASYYGTESGSQTSSGEHFNPSAMTAAHRTLPFGTKVLVTNKRNGRSVIVRINDRGPFVHGRIIDLSTAAAGVIGMRGAGVASVTVEVLGRS